jgi:hypothetical protein
MQILNMFPGLVDRAAGQPGLSLLEKRYSYIIHYTESHCSPTIERMTQSRV